MPIAVTVTLTFPYDAPILIWFAMVTLQTVKAVSAVKRVANNIEKVHVPEAIPTKPSDRFWRRSKSARVCEG